MSLYIGSQRINKIMFGNVNISAIYAGTTKIFPDEYTLDSYSFWADKSYVTPNKDGGGYRINVTSYRTDSKGVQNYVGYEIISYPTEIEVFKYDDSFSIRTTSENLSSNTILLRQKYSDKEISIYVTIAQQDEGYVDYKSLTQDGVYLLRGDYKVIRPSEFLANGYNIEAISAILVKDYRASFLLSKWSFNRWATKDSYASHYGIYDQVYTPPNIGLFAYASNIRNDYDIRNNNNEIVRLTSPINYSPTAGNYLFGYGSMPQKAKFRQLNMNSDTYSGYIPSGGYVNIIFDWYGDIKQIYQTWLPDDCVVLDSKIWTSTLYENQKRQSSAGSYYWSVKAWAADLATKSFYQPEAGTELNYVEVYPIDL